MGQIRIKLPEKTYQEVIKQAKEYDCSVPYYVERMLEKFVVHEQMSLYHTNWNNNGKNGNQGKFKFIDLFSGIGGIRLAFEKLGGHCVFSSEWDRWCKDTYFANFEESPRGDITKISLDEIPNHDILTAGFPCQPFSIAGVSKKKSLGREHGFKDKTQGTLFFNAAQIIEYKRPSMFMLENVKNLIGHDKGKTFEIIKGTLKELGYHLFIKVIDAQNYVPQHRERLFIIGFNKKIFKEEPNFKFPKIPKKQPKLNTILEEKVDKKYILSDKLWNYLQDYAKKHRERGNGFGYGLFDRNSVARTLSARYYKDGSEILIKVPRYNPRRLTPRECARLQGFPDSFQIPVSDTQAYKQFGNSVAVPVVSAVASQMIKIYKTLTKKS